MGQGPLELARNSGYVIPRKNVAKVGQALVQPLEATGSPGLMWKDPATLVSPGGGWTSGPPGQQNHGSQRPRAGSSQSPCLSSSQRSQVDTCLLCCQETQPGTRAKCVLWPDRPQGPGMSKWEGDGQICQLSNAHQNQVSMGLETSSVRLQKPCPVVPGPWSLASPLTRVKAGPWVSTLVISGNLVLFYFIVFSRLHCAACRILVPRLGLEPQATAARAQSPDQGTSRESLGFT